MREAEIFYGDAFKQTENGFVCPSVAGGNRVLAVDFCQQDSIVVHFPSA